MEILHIVLSHCISVHLFTNVGLADKFEKGLVKDLMAKYDKRLRPSSNASHSTSVALELALAQLIDVVSYYTNP